MEYIIEGLIFLFGLAVGYLSAYAKEKGKNMALKEDIGKLEEEKQEVQIKYTREIEDLKKNNTLEVELRKNKYQDKKDQFSKFFTLLDEFNNKSNAIFTEKFMPIFSEYMASSVNDDENTHNKAFDKFNKNIMNLFNELNQEYLKLTTESNSIKLISSPQIDTLLEQLNAKVSEGISAAQNMFILMATPEFLEDQTILDPLKENADVQGNEVINIKEELKKQMKIELDKI